MAPRSLPALLALAAMLAVVAPAATVGAADTPGPGSQATTAADGPLAVSVAGNTTNYLSIPTGARPEYGRSGLDVGGAVAVSSERLHGRHDALTVRRAVTDAPTDAAKLAALRAELDRLKARTAALDERHAVAVTAYQNGSRSPSQFLRRLAVHDAAAREQAALVTLVRNRLPVIAGVTLPPALDTGYDNVRADLVGLQGPVRAQNGARLAGREAPGATYVLAGEEGVVLATVDNQTYLREATDPGAQEAGEPDAFAAADRPLFAVLERTVELYPWAGAHTLRSSNTGFGNASVYRTRIVHPQGNLSVYLDGSTSDVYQEIQYKGVALVPRSDTLENETTDLRLTVNVTHRTGPAEVRVVGATTDRPVDAAVRLNGQYVGHTGDDGRLWVVQPNRRVRVNATTDAGETVTLGG